MFIYNFPHPGPVGPEPDPDRPGFGRIQLYAYTGEITLYKGLMVEYYHYPVFILS